MTLTFGDKFSLLRESELFTKDSMKGQRRYFHLLIFFCLGSSFENDYFICLDLHFLSYLRMATSIAYVCKMIGTWINLKDFYTPLGFLISLKVSPLSPKDTTWYVLIRSQAFQICKCSATCQTPCIIKYPLKASRKGTTHCELMKRMLVFSRGTGDRIEPCAVCRTQDTGQRSADDIPFVWRGG